MKLQSSPGHASLLDQIAPARKAPGQRPPLPSLAPTRRVQRTNLSPPCPRWLAVVVAVVVCGGVGGSLSLTGEVEWVLGWVAGGDGRRMERIGVWDGKACACGSGGGG